MFFNRRRKRLRLLLGGFALVSLWFWNRAWSQQQQRAERAEAALADLNREVRDKLIPALTAAVTAVRDSERMMAEVARRNER